VHVGKLCCVIVISYMSNLSLIFYYVVKSGCIDLDCVTYEIIFGIVGNLKNVANCSLTFGERSTASTWIEA